MKKEAGVIILFIFVILVVSYFVFSENSEPMSENIYNNVSNKIDVSNLLTENVVENIAENVIEENIVENNTVSEDNIETNEVTNKSSIPTTTSSANSIYESNADMGTTDKKEEAINLVKQKWGKDDTVTYRCDSITSDGEYIIAVVSKETASVKNYFKVNLENRTVEVDY